MNIQSCGMHWYLSYKTKYTDTEPEAIPNQLPLKVWRNFKEGWHFDLLI